MTTPATPAAPLRPFHIRAVHSVAMVLRKIGSTLAYYILPTRKTFVRSVLFALMGLLPFVLILLLKAPHVIIPFLLCVFFVLYMCGLTGDMRKQLRWMQRMSGQGPIFWALARGQRSLVRGSRWYYGSKLDVLPKDLTALGTSSRAATTATIKWIAPQASEFSTQAYDVQIRATALTQAAAETAVDQDGWVGLCEAHKECELCLKPLVPATAYEVRVRATNSKGSSAWRTISFVTKQKPLVLEGASGGEGPGYRWLQSLKDETVHVTLKGLQSATRARQLEVSFRPAALKVVLLPSRQTLLEGDLFASILPDDCSWEIKDADGGDGRELHLSLVKHVDKKRSKEAPLWSYLIKGHPEVDMGKVKRDEKTLEEIMAELHEADPDGMNKVQSLKEKGL